MMRAFAVLAAAAVVLVALPTTAGASADQGSAADMAVDATEGAASFLSRTSVFGLSMGVLLWLSVAVIGLTFALVALSRSRERAGDTSKELSAEFAGQSFSWSDDVAAAG